MKQLFILIFCLSFFSVDLFGQAKHRTGKNAQSRKRAPNALYLDVLGTGILPSISYERILYQHRYLFVNVRVGLGYGTEILPEGRVFSHSISFNKGANNKYFEFGFGGAIASIPEILESRFESMYMFYPIIGFRRQSVRGFLFRIYVNPLSTIDDRILYTIPFGGMSLGFTF
ncbi:MAG: hypothetical protein B6I24_01110 [Bacteroidetes bacterium 4572_128]|nr:MAG: hypothetical protein B6I24_01110 [Bacteroidetes bacterium 4572_128]